MLYLNKAALGVGQLYRYKVTYTPPETASTETSSEKSLWLKVKNHESVALRAAFLGGPFILYVDVRPENYDLNSKVYSTADQPMYEPQLKAGQSFYAELFMNKNKKQYTWIVDVVSQIIFSNTAQVQFVLSVGTSKEALSSSRDHHHHKEAIQTSAIQVSRYDTLDIWNSPIPRFDSPLHLVVITHGLHSNTGADMLYVKEAIDKAAKASGENIIVRGYFGNVRKTEKGVKYLGKRLAEYIVHELAPADPGNMPPVKKISFIGHSLGGLVQSYTIAYIAAHYPDFFERIEPANFVCLASPLLGISNENPSYIKFALDIGFVGKSGQDMGLTKKPTMPGKPSKPLLQILPTGPTHKILVQFKKRTLYANAVNDGIVPIRTSALLYLDWQGLDKLEQAKRGEDTGKAPQEATDNGPPKEAVTNPLPEELGSHKSDSEDQENHLERQHSQIGEIPEADASESTPLEMNNVSSDARSHTREKTFFETFSHSVTQPVQQVFSYFAPMAGANKSNKPPKIYTRSQTLAASPDDIEDDAHSPVAQKVEKAESLPTSNTEHSPVHFKNTKSYTTESGRVVFVPKKTSVFESGVSVLLPPLPSQSFILDPESRPPAIFHDRIYHDYDLPPPRFKKSSSFFSKNKNELVEKSKLEEAIARDWHRGMTWRKVLVRLEPDAHNNIIVRRRFANAYGWPVIDHLVKNHFSSESASVTSSTSSVATLERPSIGVGTAKSSLHYSYLDIARSRFEQQKAEQEKSEADDEDDTKADKTNSSSAASHEETLAELPGSPTSPTDLDVHNTSRESRTDSSASDNTQAWESHLARDNDDSEDEGIIFTMGNMFDNLREIGNFNFNGVSTTGDGNNYAGISTNDPTSYDAHRAMPFTDADNAVGFEDYERASEYRQSGATPVPPVEDDFDMYGPLNGDSVEERLAKQLA